MEFKYTLIITQQIVNHFETFCDIEIVFFVILVLLNYKLYITRPSKLLLVIIYNKNCIFKQKRKTKKSKTITSKWIILWFYKESKVHVFSKMSKHGVEEVGRAHLSEMKFLNIPSSIDMVLWHSRSAFAAIRIMRG